MPYDPTYPTDGTPATGAPMRAQFQSIVDLIGTIPQGPQGVAGPPGTSVTGAVVDGVATVNPGDSATASASFDGANVHFSFGIPRGLDGTPGAAGGQGIQGIQGIQGDVGPQGPMFTSFNVNSTTTLDPSQPASVQTFFDGASIRFNFGIPRGNDGLQGPTGQTGATGPAFTNFTVDSVTTLQPFQPATVVATFDGTFVRFAFGIPQGEQGQQGNNGFDGSPGAQGPQGPPFTSFVVDATNTLPAGQPASVTVGFNGTNVGFTFGIPQGAEGPQGIQGPAGPSDLSATSNNTNGVSVLGMAVSDPPTQAQMQAIANKLDELIGALRRV
jgi:hypothetical protein